MTATSVQLILGSFFVAGLQFYNVDLNLLRRGDVVELVPEPENAHDDKAIKLVVHGRQIGHVPREQTIVYHWAWSKGAKPVACIDIVDPQKRSHNQVVVQVQLEVILP